jgi:hypothetical protein
MTRMVEGPDEVDPFGLPGSSAEQSRPRAGRVVLVVAIVGILVVVFAGAGLAVVKWLDGALGPGCATASWQASAVTEARLLLPPDSGDPYITRHDCDDQGYVSVDVDAPDPSAALAHMRSAAAAQGWLSSGSTSGDGEACYEKPVGGERSSLVLGADVARHDAGMSISLGGC